jgi:hypothetical protein
LAWAWATAVMPARFMAATVAARMRVRVSLDMIVLRSSGSRYELWYRLTGDAWPAGLRPAVTSQGGPRPALAVRSVTNRFGRSWSLVSSLGMGTSSWRACEDEAAP